MACCSSVVFQPDCSVISGMYYLILFVLYMVAFCLEASQNYLLNWVDGFSALTISASL